MHAYNCNVLSIFNTHCFAEEMMTHIFHADNCNTLVITQMQTFVEEKSAIIT